MPASASVLAADIRAGRRRAVDVVEDHLARIAVMNPTLNALTVVFADRALEAAARVDHLLARGDEVGPLAGVPFSVKENIDLAWSATTHGWRGAADAVPAHDASIVRRMRDAGAIPLARGNMPDFGMRWDTDNDLFGRTLNPWDPQRSAGGSSGGDAVAVATGMSAVGLGNDYGGSLRVPASANGVAGLRPSFARVPRAAVENEGVALTLQQFSVNGVLGRTVDDLELVLGVIEGPDPDDAVSRSVPFAARPDAPRRVGVVSGLRTSGDVARAVDRAAAALAAAGWDVVPVVLPHLEEAAVLWRRLACTDMLFSLGPGELSSPLGVSAATFLRDSTAAAQPFETAREYSDAWGRRAVIAAEWRRLQAEVPLILGPVSSAPTPALDVDLGGQEATTRRVDELRLTVAVNFLGLPAVAVAAGLDANGMPVGVQMIAEADGDRFALAAARDVEAALGLLVPPGPAD